MILAEFDCTRAMRVQRYRLRVYLSTFIMILFYTKKLLLSPFNEYENNLALLSSIQMQVFTNSVSRK